MGCQGLDVFLLKKKNPPEEQLDFGTWFKQIVTLPICCMQINGGEKSLFIF